MAINYSNKYNQKPSLSKYFLLSLILVMIGITMYFSNFLVQRAQTLFVAASSGNAQLFFEPTSLTLAPNALVNLWITTDKPLGFVRSEFTFDPTLIKLTQEISLTNSALKRVIKVTSMSEANTTGKVVITLGIDPTMLSSAPNGSFKIAGLSFAAKVTTPNLSSTLTMLNNNLQLVDTSALVFTSTTTSSTLIINPTISSTPTPSPTIAPTPTPAGTKPPRGKK